MRYLFRLALGCFILWYLFQLGPIIGAGSTVAAFILTYCF